MEDPIQKIQFRLLLTPVLRSFAEEFVAVPAPPAASPAPSAVVSSVGMASPVVIPAPTSVVPAPPVAVPAPPAVVSSVKMASPVVVPDPTSVVPAPPAVVSSVGMTSPAVGPAPPAAVSSVGMAF